MESRCRAFGNARCFPSGVFAMFLRAVRHHYLHRILLLGLAGVGYYLFGISVALIAAALATTVVFTRLLLRLLRV